MARSMHSTVSCDTQTSSGSPGMAPLGLLATLVLGLCVTHHAVCLCCSCTQHEAYVPPVLCKCTRGRRLSSKAGRRLRSRRDVELCAAPSDPERCSCFTVAIVQVPVEPVRIPMRAVRLRRAVAAGPGARVGRQADAQRAAEARREHGGPISGIRRHGHVAAEAGAPGFITHWAMRWVLDLPQKPVRQQFRAAQ